jgi:hypothetical protein
MEEKQLTSQESLQLIQQMIHQAKQEQKDDGKGWIIWGWLLFVASVGTWVNLQMKWFSPYFFWNSFSILTLAALLYKVVRVLFFPKKKKVRTYTKDLFAKLNIGFFIFVAFIIVATSNGLGPAKGFSLLIGLYGFWILIYGTALNFRPSIIAAFVTWAIGFVALFVDNFADIMLLHAGAVLCGYIIPGHMAYSAFNKMR